ncbi:TetR/AcrR family transcriptional regulator [Streptomyces californicus]|uniref:TetR/AcrR family transcriptional regulator n=1 Tax=Streptomyces californicus TaxID=67351 RepID=UPI0036D1F965
MASRSTQILEAAARVIARRGVRGLRVEELAAEAGVSTALIYYHFKDRTGILLRTLEFINDRAERYTAHRDPGAGALSPREELDRTLLLELQDATEVRENSSAWGELRASAVFDEALREDLARATLVWNQEVAGLLGAVRPTAPAPALAASAERLTALMEGLSMRWLSGTLPIAHARTLMGEAIDTEVERLGRAGGGVAGSAPQPAGPSAQEPAGPSSPSSAGQSENPA